MDYDEWIDSGYFTDEIRARLKGNTSFLFLNICKVYRDMELLKFQIIVLREFSSKSFGNKDVSLKSFIL